MVVKRPFHGVEHRDKGGLVENIIHALHGTGQRRRMAYVLDDKFHLLAHRGQVALIAGGEIVQHPHGPALRQ